MKYEIDVVRLHKKELRGSPIHRMFKEGAPIERMSESVSIITIVHDSQYMLGLVDSVYKQIDDLKRLGVTPVSVTMSHKTYEQMIIHNFNLTHDAVPKTLFGLIPVISIQFQNFQIEVQASAHEEFLYREELSKLRYEREEHP